MLQEIHVHLTVEAQEQGPRGTELNFKRQAEVSQAGKSKGSRAARTDARVDAEARRSQTIAKLGAVALMAVWWERYLQMKGTLKSDWRSFKYQLATELGHYSAGQGKSRKKGADPMGQGERLEEVRFLN